MATINSETELQQILIFFKTCVNMIMKQRASE